MNLKFRAWDRETKSMNGMAEIYRNRKQEIELHARDESITLMQSTGLTDYNGREIFEGDVVKMSMNFYSNPTYYEVVRSMGGTYRLESGQHGCELWLRHADCYIVGNIYENTELLDELK
ncbi:YopX family protein [Streptococcus thermophilus]